MRRLVPSPLRLDPSATYPSLALPVAPWVGLGMVSSVDGATAVDGSSRALGGSGDRAAFRAVRALADVVLVGLGTATTERYRATWQVRDPAGRALRDQPPLPRLAIVTGSGAVPEDLRALQDPDRPPLVVTTDDGAPTARARVGERAEVVTVEADGGRVLPRAVLSSLAERGLPRVVLEGGPTLNHAFLAADLVDELFVTIAPALVGGGTGLAGEQLPGPPRRLVLHELRVAGSELLCRYRLLSR